MRGPCEARAVEVGDGRPGTGPRRSPLRLAVRSPWRSRARCAVRRGRPPATDAARAIQGNPAASTTASRTGRNATPSPGAGHRWVMALASSPIEDTNSLARRDFPIPASPRTVNRARAAGADDAPERGSQRVSSPWRPNIGASNARAMAGAPATISRICQPVVPVGAPSSGFMITAPRRSRCAAGPTTTSPSGAACCNRPAARTSGPATASRSAAPGPATTISPSFDARPRPVDGHSRSPTGDRSAPCTAACASATARTALSAVVLVRHREPEERDQRIPELALDAPAVSLDHLGRDPRAVSAEAPDGLGIHVRGRAGGDVEDGDRHRPALAGQPRPRGAGGRDRGAPGRRLEDGVLPQDRRSRAHAGRGRVRGPAPRRSSERASWYAWRAAA